MLFGGVSILMDEVQEVVIQAGGFNEILNQGRANMNGNKYLEYMGYDTDIVNIKPMGLYKIGQVLTYIKQLFYNYRKYLFIHYGIFVSILIVACILYGKSMFQSLLR